MPPDLTQLSADPRYQAPDGSVSAASFQSAATGPAATAKAPTAPLAMAGDLRVERLGTQRWLATPQTPEQVWPQLEAFWRERSIVLTTNDPAAGVMETEWVENRAKLPNDIIRNTLGKVFDSLYSTGERDKFRVRVERTANNGSEIFVAHRGLEEVFTNDQKDATKWQARATDPLLEAEFLSRIMTRIAPIKTDVAKAAVTDARSPQARARIVEGRGAPTLQVDDSFERAWRRVGLALDRSGFTVEDRDRAQGLYFVRYIDASKSAAKSEPGFLPGCSAASPKPRTNRRATAWQSRAKAKRARSRC